MLNAADLLELILRAASVGSIYTLIALGYNVIFATTNILNFAHGETFMVGTLIAFGLRVGLGAPLWVSLLAAIVLGAAFGLITESTAVHPVVRKAPGSWGWLLSTLGIGTVARRLAEIATGNEAIPVPAILPDRPYPILGVKLNPQFMVPVIAAVLITVGLQLFFTRTMVGMAIVATAQDRDAARLRGVNVRRMSLLAFAIGSAIGTLTGFLVAPITFAYAGVGALFAMKGFVAAAAGGIGSNYGALLGGLMLALVEEVGVLAVGAGYRDVLAVLLILGIMLLRPEGFFGSSPAREV